MLVPKKLVPLQERNREARGKTSLKDLKSSLIKHQNTVNKPHSKRSLLLYRSTILPTSHKLCYGDIYCSYVKSDSAELYLYKSF